MHVEEGVQIPLGVQPTHHMVNLHLQHILEDAKGEKREGVTIRHRECLSTFQWQCAFGLTIPSPSH